MATQLRIGKFYVIEIRRRGKQNPTFTEVLSGRSAMDVALDWARRYTQLKTVTEIRVYQVQHGQHSNVTDSPPVYTCAGSHLIHLLNSY